MAYLLLPKNSTSSGANLAVISMGCDQWPDLPGGPYWGSYYIRLNFVTIQCSLDSRVLLTRSAHFLLGEKRKKRAALLSGSGYLCFPGSSAFLHSPPPTSFSLWPTFFGSQLLASLWDTKILTSVKCTLARKASKEARLFNFCNIMVNWRVARPASSHFSCGTIRIGANKA